jgi:hypothetical protein
MGARRLSARWASLTSSVLVLGAVAAGDARAQAPRPPAPSAFEVTDADRDGLISAEEYAARMHEVFFLLDRNKDGSLIRSEVPLASDAAFQAADRNRDGRLSLQEYIEARMKDFEAADRDRSGRLSADEAAGK